MTLVEQNQCKCGAPLPRHKSGNACTMNGRRMSIRATATPSIDKAKGKIQRINANRHVDPKSKLEWSQDGKRMVLKETEQQKINPIEKMKLRKDPLQMLEWIDEMAKQDFETLDASRKEAQEDIDMRLKWLGLFHRRKQHYGHFMSRLKVPNGILTSAQMRMLAKAVASYGSQGCGDLTTRQNIQVRGLKLSQAPELLRGLAQCGLTSLQSGMDNVRNAVGSPLAGIDPLEVYDTRQLCIDLTNYITMDQQGNPRVTNLPRKWNVCVVGSHDLYEHPHINDLAYWPAEKNGQFGFNLLVGGYFSATKCEEAIELDAWVSEEEAVEACDAVLTTFRDLGARSSRQKCRMMWLIHDLGLERFRQEVEERMPGKSLERMGTSLIDASHTRRNYHGVWPQKQAGLNYVGLNVPTGRIQASDMFEIARLAEEYGCGEVRVTVEQNYILPGIPDDKVESLLQEPLLTTGEGFASPFIPFPGNLMKNLVACTGNQFCGLAMIETKAQGKTLTEALEATMDIPADVRMHWTGCPNTCGQVQVADIGFLGCKTTDKSTGKKVEGVKIFLGGEIGHDSVLGTEIAEIPCQHLLPYLQQLLEENFNAVRKGSLTEADKQAVERWERFPFNSGGTPSVFPPNENGKYVTVPS